MFGCYEALHLGSVTEALEDFTGGVAESVDIEKGKYASQPEKRKELFNMMKERIEKGALLGAFITVNMAVRFQGGGLHGVPEGPSSNKQTKPKSDPHVLRPWSRLILGTL